MAGDRDLGKKMRTNRAGPRNARCSSMCTRMLRVHSGQQGAQSLSRDSLRQEGRHEGNSLGRAMGERGSCGNPLGPGPSRPEGAGKALWGHKVPCLSKDQLFLLGASGSLATSL